MTRFEHVPLGAQPVQAWANGGGNTRQVAIEPRDGSLARGFRWRVSIAQVASSGPFSILPGVDRSLWLLRGGGVRLALGDRTVVLDRALQRFHFAGEIAIACTLLGGACEDLNVMTARATTRVEAHVHELAAGAELRCAAGDGERLLVALRGSCVVVGAAPPVREREALRGSAVVAWQVAAGDAPCALLVATFAPR